MNKFLETLFMHPEILIWSYLFVINVISFSEMGIDKHLARTGKSRISEEILFFTSLIFGSIGGIVGMWLFRHKTKHRSFVFGLPLLLIIQVILLIVIFS